MDAQADLGLHGPHIPKDTFSHGAAHIKSEFEAFVLYLFNM